MARAGPDEWWRQSKSDLDSALILKKSGKSREAYFHAGQSIEFIIKAIFLRRNNHQFMPDKYKGAHWHDLKSCFDEARLRLDLEKPETPKPLKANWLTVRDWRANARFPDLKVPQQELNDLFVAVCHDPSGVWPWLDVIYRNL